MIFIKIVWLVFLYVIITFLIGVIFSKIRINIDDIEIDTDNIRNNKIKIKVEIYLFGFWKTFSLNIGKKNIKSFNFKKLFLLKSGNNKISNDINLKIEKLKIDLSIGSENVIITGDVVVLLSTILSTIICLNYNKVNSKYYYKISPIYQNRNVIKLKLESIISIKMVHILYVILKIRRRENGRTSNRRAYANSNE